jgi:hypothetical protein
MGVATSVKPYAKMFWINAEATTSFTFNIDQRSAMNGTLNQKLGGPVWLQFKTDWGRWSKRRHRVFPEAELSTWHLKPELRGPHTEACIACTMAPSRV